jgi:hypothetical protein
MWSTQDAVTVGRFLDAALVSKWANTFFFKTRTSPKSVYYSDRLRSQLSPQHRLASGTVNRLLCPPMNAHNYA